MTLDWLFRQNKEETDPQCLQDVHFTVILDGQTWRCTLMEHGASFVIEVNPPENFWDVSASILIRSESLLQGDREYLSIIAITALAKREVLEFLQHLTTNYSCHQNENIDYITSQTEESYGSQLFNTDSDTPATNSPFLSWLQRDIQNMRELMRKTDREFIERLEREKLSQLSTEVTITMDGVLASILTGEKIVLERTPTGGIVITREPAPMSLEQDLQTDQSGSLKENLTPSYCLSTESTPTPRQAVVDQLLNSLDQFYEGHEERFIYALTKMTLDVMLNDKFWKCYNDLTELDSLRVPILETYYRYYRKNLNESWS